jgi:hypothetical protein
MKLATIAFLLSLQTCACFSTCGINNRRSLCLSVCNEKDDDCITTDRRALLINTLIAIASPAQALDFDSFESSQISKSAPSNPTLSDDEALCKYGAPGRSMGEACERAKMKPRLPAVVDAYGKADRGDYLKCRIEYPIVDGNYKRTRVCKQSYEWGPP